MLDDPVFLYMLDGLLFIFALDDFVFVFGIDDITHQRVFVLNFYVLKMFTNDFGIFFKLIFISYKSKFSVKRPN